MSEPIRDTHVCEFIEPSGPRDEPIECGRNASWFDSTSGSTWCDGHKKTLELDPDNQEVEFHQLKAA